MGEKVRAPQEIQASRVTLEVAVTNHEKPKLSLANVAPVTDPEAEYQERIWVARDRFNPNNWFRIPDFDVDPAEEGFQGFDRPIRYPGDVRLTNAVRGLVQIARDLVRKDGVTSVLELLQASIDALDLWSSSPESQAAYEQMSARQYAGFLYTWTVGALEGLDPGAEGSLGALAFASEWIASWALHGAEGLLVKERLQRAQKRNAGRLRAGVRDELRSRAVAALRSQRMEQRTRREALDALTESPPDGLKVTRVGDDEFLFEDEYTGDRKLAPTKTLESWWTEAGKRPPRDAKTP